MVKGNAVNMKYSQKITACSELSGVQQGTFSIKKGETYVSYNVKYWEIDNEI
ncbi:hypothetical protein [Flavobacterium sp.]|uniref:hypothetical protein n=1 Tax=Flavobacterium sp. TaxID=239 RepID=UPI003262EB3C